jgi:hypothetical protein
LSYLKGLQLEVEEGKFAEAKQWYLNSLINPLYVNHRIRKTTLMRIMRINSKMGLGTDSPEKTLISRYYIKQKYVQVILDTSSFGNTKTLKAIMSLPKMIFSQMGPNDHFGLKILKNGWSPLLA